MYIILKNGVSKGQYECVEGIATDFVSATADGHRKESFRVRTFAYSDYHISAGLNNKVFRGGPIHKSAHIRIWHIGNSILRLEVARAPVRNVVD